MELKWPKGQTLIVSSMLLRVSLDVESKMEVIGNGLSGVFDN